MRKSFVREKRIVAGSYQEVNLYMRTMEQERSCKTNRKRRKYLTKPAQAKWNDQSRKKYAKLLIYTNFGKGDYYMTFTHNDDSLPKTPADAKRIQENVLKKMKRLYQKHGLELKYIWFTSYQFDEDKGYIKRIHHHVLVNAGVSRDDVEGCWSTGRGKNKRMLGRTQAQLIQPGMNGLEDLATYLTGQEKWEKRQWKKGQKRWSSSKNLKKPFETRNDNAWSQRKLLMMGKDYQLAEELLLKRFSGYQLLGEIKAVEHEESGWHIHAAFLKIDERSGSG